MYILPFKILKPKRQSFLYQEDKLVRFYDKFHHHEEVQISLVLKGNGKLHIGDTVTDYKSNDIFIIGSNVPHMFKSHDELDEESHMMSVFFNRESFGDNFFKLEELQCLHKLFEKTQCGVKLLSNKYLVKNIFLQLKTVAHIKRLIFLLEILQLFCRSEVEMLSKSFGEKLYIDSQDKRLRVVCEYTMENFEEDISLDKVSNMASMTSNAFCRYFKQKTNKTYFQFLAEIRIENACKLLSEDNDFTIAEIAYKSGFNNISNFNRKFKSIKKVCPAKYKSFTQLEAKA